MFQLIEASSQIQEENGDGATGFFGKYDYGSAEENQRHYNGSTVPPSFNLNRVTAPLYIFYGNGDKLIAEEDVKVWSGTRGQT